MTRNLVELPSPSCWDREIAGSDAGVTRPVCETQQVKSTVLASCKLFEDSVGNQREPLAENTEPLVMVLRFETVTRRMGKTKQTEPRTRLQQEFILSIIWLPMTDSDVDGTKKQCTLAGLRCCWSWRSSSESGKWFLQCQSRFSVALPPKCFVLVCAFEVFRVGPHRVGS